MENETKQVKKSRATKIILALFVLVVLFTIYGVYSNLQGTLHTAKKSADEDMKRVEDVVKSTEEKDVATASKAEIVSQKVKDGDYGNSYIVGEVKNMGKVPVSFVKITATFYNKDNEVEGTDFTFAGDTANVDLKPNETSPFKISFEKKEVNFDHYKLDITWNE